MFKNLFGAASVPTAGKDSLRKIAMITNFTSCRLGMAFVNRLASSPHIDQVVAVSHDADRFTNDKLMAHYSRDKTLDHSKLEETLSKVTTF